MKSDEWQRQKQSTTGTKQGNNRQSYNNGYIPNSQKNNKYDNRTGNIAAVPKRNIDFANFDVVDEAEKVIKSLDKDNWGKIKLTTSQIRKFLTAVNIIKNKVDICVMQSGSTVLNEDLAMEIKFLKVNILYQGGRENVVKDFIEKSGIVEMIAGIGSDLKRFEKFCKYVEALVAYHKFYEGKD